MKKYIKPEIIILEFDLVDIISLSVPSIPEDDNDVKWEEA